jgi:hypothetical protein
MSRRIKPPSQDEFKKECRDAFHYLLDYDFVELPASEPTNPYDRFVMRFANATTRIMIRGGGYGTWTDVFFDRKEPIPSKYNRGYGTNDGYNLLNLFAVRKPDFPLRDYVDIYLDGMGRGCLIGFVSAFLPRDSPEIQNDQRLQIREYARALREVGTDILQGDFSVLPAVEIEAEKRHAKMRKIEMAGVRASQPNPLSIAPQAHDTTDGSDANGS